MTRPVSYDNSGHGFNHNSYHDYCYGQSPLGATSKDSRALPPTARYQPNSTSSSPGWRIFSLLTKVLCIQSALGYVPVPDIDRSTLHPREIKAIDVSFSRFFDSYKTAQEWLRFRADDPREKLLFLSADSDWNGALDPDALYPLMSSLNTKFDIKFKVIASHAHVCEQIRAAKKLAHVFINAHGNPNLLVLNDDPEELIVRTSEFYNCFNDVDPRGKIFLLSCSTGKAQNGNCCDNIAQDMATRSRRTVIAATGLFVSKAFKISSIDPLMFTHDEFVHEGILHKTKVRVFYPMFSSCQTVVENGLHPRETMAIDAVSTNLIARNFLWEQPTFSEMQDYLTLCKDNPKKKFLFLSSKQQNCGGADDIHRFCSHSPNTYAKFLTDIAEHFDLRFKVIEFENDICTEIRSANQMGELAAVFIHVTRNATKLSLDDETTKNRQAKEDSWLDFTQFFQIGDYLDLPVQSNFPACLSDVPRKARIFFGGGSIGLSESGKPSDALAYKIARASGREIFAPIGGTYASRFTLTSIDPVDIYHRNTIPAKPFSFFDPSTYFARQKEENIFKMFKVFKYKEEN